MFIAFTGIFQQLLQLFNVSHEFSVDLVVRTVRVCCVLTGAFGIYYLLDAFICDLFI